jgi:hypothetical protein
MQKPLIYAHQHIDAGTVHSVQTGSCTTLPLTQWVPALFARGKAVDALS